MQSRAIVSMLLAGLLMLVWLRWRTRPNRMPRQQNLWVRFGSGSRPRLCRRARSATGGLRTPSDLLVTSLTSVFRPATAPDETSPRARNPFGIHGRCVRIVRATVLIGSGRDRLSRPVHSSRDFPAQAAPLDPQRRGTSSRRRYAGTVPRSYFHRPDGVTVGCPLPSSGRFGPPPPD